MAWQILDIESGDVLAAYRTQSDARAAYVAHVSQYPEVAHDLVVEAVPDRQSHPPTASGTSVRTGRRAAAG